MSWFNNKNKDGGINKMEHELEAINDSRASFYGKAVVRTEGDKTILRSYSTDVAYIENGKAVVNGSYSQTTLRHINEFLKQNGFTADSWKQIEKDYSLTAEEQDKASGSMFKSVAMVAAIGNVLCDNKKDKNDWKLRMLKAGLENKGLSVPEDWDTLTESEKEKRLDGVISIATTEAV